MERLIITLFGPNDRKALEGFARLASLCGFTIASSGLVNAQDPATSGDDQLIWRVINLSQDEKNTFGRLGVYYVSSLTQLSMLEAWRRFRRARIWDHRFIHLANHMAAKELTFAQCESPVPLTQAWVAYQHTAPILPEVNQKLSERMVNALRAADIVCMELLSQLELSDLRDVPGIGRNTAGEIIVVVQKYLEAH